MDLETFQVLTGNKIIENHDPPFKSCCKCEAVLMFQLFIVQTSDLYLCTAQDSFGAESGIVLFSYFYMVAGSRILEVI